MNKLFYLIAIIILYTSCTPGDHLNPYKYNEFMIERFESYNDSTNIYCLRNTGCKNRFIYIKLDNKYKIGETLILTQK